MTVVRGGMARETIDEEIGPREDLPYLLVQLGSILLIPDEFGKSITVSQDIAIDPVEVFYSQGFQAGNGLLPALVVTEDAGPEDVAIPIEWNHSLAERTD